MSNLNLIFIVGFLLVPLLSNGQQSKHKLVTPIVSEGELIKTITPTAPHDVSPPAYLVKYSGPNGEFVTRKQLWANIPVEKQHVRATYKAEKALLLTHHDWESNTKLTFPEAESQIAKFLSEGMPVISLLQSLDGKAGVDRGAYPKGTDSTD